MRIMWKGEEFNGSPEEIIRQAKLDSFIIEHTLRDFMDSVAYRIEIWSGDVIQFRTSDEFLRELNRVGAIQIVREENDNVTP